jgi:hypothetical protein
MLLQFSAGDGLASEAIRRFSRGWPTHVDVVVPDGLLGARLDGGVKIREPGYAVFNRTLTVRLASTAEQEVRFTSFLYSQLGKPYDSEAIAGLALGRDWRDDSKWFCSELIAAALEVSGWLPKPLAFASHEITPRDLLLVVSPWAT